ncbi:RICIN domain-containing protein, partial [Nonomuraea fuscirosea]
MRRLLVILSSLLMVGVFLPPQASAATVDTNAWYVLVNRNSGKALDVYNLATNDGARITQWTRNNGNQQQWQFVDSGGGYYRVKSRHSGKVLDVSGFS